MPAILVIEALLIATYVVLGFSARKWFDHDKLLDSKMPNSWLFWYPFVWPFYSVYLPEASLTRRFGALTLGLAITLLFLWSR